MGIVTKGRHPAPRPRLVSGPLALMFLAEFGTLTSFFLLLSAVPMLAAAAGAGPSGTGLVTGSLLLGTVVAEAAASVALSRLGYRNVLATGAVLLGGPAIALLLLPHEPQAAMMAVSFVRGLGFGLCGVATGAVTAMLLPPERRGEGLGLLGIVSGTPAIVALPAGVWLAGHHLIALVSVLALVTGLLPLAARPALGAVPDLEDGSAEQDNAEQGNAEQGKGSRGRPAARDGLRLPLIFAAVTVAAGVVDSFLPIARGVPSGLSSAVLLVSAVAATISRWQAGR